MQMIRNITEGKFKFGSPEWDDISELPKDLVSFMQLFDISIIYQICLHIHTELILNLMLFVVV